MLTFETWDIEKLIPYDRNPRVNDHAVDKVASAIKEYGFRVPIVAKSDGLIVDGHLRFKAARKLGLKEVPIILADDMTDAQIKAFRISVNKMAELADWDEEMLSIEMQELFDIGYDLDVIGFSPEELEELDLNMGGELEAIIDESKADDVPEVEENPVIKLGDIIELGNHRLMCGDSTKEEDVAKLMDGQKFKLLFTDPPYELQTQGGGILASANSMKQIKDNGVDKFDPMMLSLIADTNIFCHNKPLIKKYIELAELNSKTYDLCFYKKNNVAPNYGGHMMTDTEYIAIIGSQSPNKGHDKETYSKAYYGDKDKDNSLSYSKPVGLCEKFLKLYADDKVIDIFGGSGSTMIAGENLNISTTMMEKLPQYAQVIIQRWCDYTLIDKIKINGEEVSWSEYKEKNAI